MQPEPKPVTWDTYLCCRDHDRGPGEWAVRGPGIKNLEVPNRSIGEAIAALFNVDLDSAAYNAVIGLAYERKRTVDAA